MGGDDLPRLVNDEDEALGRAPSARGAGVTGATAGPSWYSHWLAVLGGEMGEEVAQERPAGEGIPLALVRGWHQVEEIDVLCGGDGRRQRPADAGDGKTANPSCCKPGDQSGVE